ncbi:MAG TPA: acetate/propionate family kinase [Ilumatobacter sp.]|nr:acetate/propionate family kinase [Ilumatobacter sp.]
MSVLVVNTGGVTLELTVVADDDRVVDHDLIDPWDGRATDPIVAIAERQHGIAAVGHRIVHGGRHTQPTLITDAVVDDLERAGDLAPVHQERAMLAVAAARARLPDVPHVACFDTTFHATIPDHAATYPLPAEWRDHWPLRRTGFHGLSHAHVARRAPLIAGHPCRRVVSCHLGSGASVCAIRDGESVDTTMGMTPLEGLTMVTRSGSVDPGLLIWLLREERLSLDELDDGLNHRSGLAGLTGGSGDMREVLQRRADGDSAAALAFDVYVHHLTHGIAAMAASLGGIDVLAFTGGVGQHVPEVRRAAVDRLAHLGLSVDADRNDVATSDADISARSATNRCIVVTTGEHHTIAELTRVSVASPTGRS